MLTCVNALDDLKHRASPPPVLLRRAEVPSDTWAGLLADGAYRRLTDGCALRADAAEDADCRAQALPGPLPVRSVVGRRSAAWVHLGGDPPGRLDLLVPPGRRVDPAPGRRCSEARLATADVVVLGGHPVTTPTRTLFDLVLVPEADALWPTLTALCDIGADPADALTRFTRRRRGACHARLLLTGLREGSSVEAPTGQARMTGSEAALAPVIRYTS